jgi:hypothetical protein
MLSIIYCNIDAETNLDTIKTLSLLSNDVTYIGYNSADLKNLKAEYLVPKTNSSASNKQKPLTASLLRAINTVSGDNILLLAETACPDTDINQIIKKANELKINESILVFNDENLNSLEKIGFINYTMELKTYPIQGIVLSKQYIQQNLLQSPAKFSELLAHLFLKALADGYTFTNFISAKSEGSLITVTDFEKAGLLEDVVNNINIEELYPDHKWKEYENESAAASYQSLAANFIRLGDCQRAQDCLNISDQLEESPRAMALRAMIAHARGETLGAVAGLVTSLQHYEVRKRNEDGTHYLNFKPNDLENINTRLQRGLSALNNRDNETALRQFAMAVYNFDSFYSENGIKDLLA